jgi:hypothetical protein
LVQIPHEEARRLINLNADRHMEADKYSVLNAHLNDCSECRGYADELLKVENVLRGLGQKFNRHPTPSFTDQILVRSRSSSFLLADKITILRAAAAVLVFAGIFFGLWQFSIFNSTSAAETYTAVPLPTPSTYLTSTNTLPSDCEHVPYQIREGDTLESIAEQFSVPKNMIMEFNDMQEEGMQPPMLVRIPLCARTPTITIYPPNTTITITPQFEPITPTPG